MGLIRSLARRLRSMPKEPSTWPDGKTHDRLFNNTVHSGNLPIREFQAIAEIGPHLRKFLSRSKNSALSRHQHPGSSPLQPLLHDLKQVHVFERFRPKRHPLDQFRLVQTYTEHEARHHHESLASAKLRLRRLTDLSRLAVREGLAEM